MMKTEKKWMRLDNAAKIYPAAKRRKWTSLFRLSADLDREIDPAVLARAAEVTVKRFPSINVRLGEGLFWYYLEENDAPPLPREDGEAPCLLMKKAELKRCAFRILYYRSRIAVEFFHSLTDGTGGMIFLKNLVAEYLFQERGIEAPFTHGLLDRRAAPDPEELEDSFLRYAGEVRKSPKEAKAYRLPGRAEAYGVRHLTVGTLELDAIKEKAKEYGATLTVFLTAVMIKAIVNIEERRVPIRALRKPVKVLVPINLRRFFPSRTLRNFALFVTPGVEPRLGSYDLDEIVRIVYHSMGISVAEKELAARIASNVQAEKTMALKLMPLFIKNFAMKLVYNSVGEKKSCICMSNLGQADFPEEIAAHVRRMDFILGPLSMSNYTCGVVTFGGKLRINFVNVVRDPELEREFFRLLRSLGLHVYLESNE